MTKEDRLVYRVEAKRGKPNEIFKFFLTNFEISVKHRQGEI